MTRKHIALATAVIVGTFVFHTCELRAEDDSTASAQPKNVADVFDRYASAVGGKDAINALKSRVTTAETTLEEYSVVGKVELIQKAPNSFYGAFKLDDVGTFDRGFDGKAGWSNSPFNGVQDQKGLGLALLKEEAELHLPARMLEFFQGAKIAGRKTLKGGEATVVEVPADGKPTELYFDMKSGLLVGWKRQVESQSGVTTEEAHFEEYQEVDGVKIPFRIRKSTSELTSVTDVIEVKHNVDIADSRFAKPAR